MDLTTAVQKMRDNTRKRAEKHLPTGGDKMPSPSQQNLLNLNGVDPATWSRGFLDWEGVKLFVDNVCNKAKTFREEVHKSGPASCKYCYCNVLPVW